MNDDYEDYIEKRIKRMLAKCVAKSPLQSAGGSVEFTDDDSDKYKKGENDEGHR